MQSFFCALIIISIIKTRLLSGSLGLFSKKSPAYFELSDSSSDAHGGTATASGEGSSAVTPLSKSLINEDVAGSGYTH